MIVADNYTIINTQGIRYAEKVDQVFLNSYRYSLRVQYKGSELNYIYPTSAERDAQFDRLAVAMQKGKPCS